MMDISLTVNSGVATLFQSIEVYAGDPILSLMENSHQNTRMGRVNFSIGLHYNEQLIIPRLDAVQQVEERRQVQPQKASMYLQIGRFFPLSQHHSDVTV